MWQYYCRPCLLSAIFYHKSTRLLIKTIDALMVHHFHIAFHQQYQWIAKTNMLHIMKPKFMWYLKSCLNHAVHLLRLHINSALYAFTYSDNINDKEQMEVYPSCTLVELSSHSINLNLSDIWTTPTCLH